MYGTSYHYDVAKKNSITHQFQLKNTVYGTLRWIHPVRPRFALVLATHRWIKFLTYCIENDRYHDQHVTWSQWCMCPRVSLKSISLTPNH